MLCIFLRCFPGSPLLFGILEGLRSDVRSDPFANIWNFLLNTEGETQVSGGLVTELMLQLLTQT